MKLKNLLLTIILTLCVAGVCGTVAYAEDVEDVLDTAVPDETVVEETFTAPSYTVHIKYAEDSSAINGMSYETYIDPATLAVSFKIVEDLSIGHVIYDDPATPYIDGIRVNGSAIDTLNVPVEDGTAYEVVIRTVYEDNLLGDFAKLIDGKFDIRTILENPVTLFMAVYYILAICSIVFATFATVVSKDKSVKTADEIASKVEASAEDAVVTVRTEVLDAVLNEVKPMLQTIVDDVKNIVTAVTLSTSNNKDAPIAMLETLQKSAESSDLNGLIDDIRKNVSESISKKVEAKAANLEALRAIAHASEETALVETASETSSIAPKSVF